MGRYTDTPTQTVIRLANKGDKDACMELSLRYSTGTALLEKNPSKAEYWRKQSFMDHQEMSYSHTTPNYTSMTTSETSTLENIPESKKYDWAITPDKNKHEYVIGIDFGHGETSAAFCAIEWEAPASNLSSVKSLQMDGDKKVMPSAICISRDNQAYIGSKAFDPQNLNSSQTNVCFKKRPTDIHGKSECLMIRFMHEVYRQILETVSQFTDTNHIVYIATPSGWKEHDKYLYGLMAQKAGIPIGGIIPESRAALFKAKEDVASGLPQFVNKGVIVFDMGSSTLDFSYLQGSNPPIDDGDDCGASFVEKSMYEDKKKECDVISLFENKYPNLKDALLFKVREIKEAYYQSSINGRFVKSINFDELVEPEDEDFGNVRIRFIIMPDDLKKSLEEKHYIDRIRKAMLDFREKLNGKPIYGVFLTGGASRMDFIMPLVKECWEISENAIPKDTDPSLAISEGVALAARADIRSGGVGNIKKEIAELTEQSETKIYNLFTTSLVEKISSEVSDTVGACITQFKNQNEDVSISDLEIYINENIENDMNNVSVWAEECYQKAFEQETAELRERLEKKVSNYSQQTIAMQKGNVSLQSLPNLDTSVISEQMRAISSDLMDSGFLKDITAGIAGGAIAGAIFMLLGGPLAWILGGAAAFFANYFLGDNDSEEEKKQKARMKDLNKESRQKVYDHFETHWDEITSQIQTSVQNAIYSNSKLQAAIETQSKKIILDYAKECLIQTRSMVD